MRQSVKEKSKRLFIYYEKIRTAFPEKAEKEIQELTAIKYFKSIGWDKIKIDARIYAMFHADFSYPTRIPNEQLSGKERIIDFASSVLSQEGILTEFEGYKNFEKFKKNSDEELRDIEKAYKGIFGQGINY